MIPEDAEKSPSNRKDSKFSPLMCRLKLYKNSKTNFIYQGLPQKRKMVLEPLRKASILLRIISKCGSNDSKLDLDYIIIDLNANQAPGQILD